MHSIPRATKIIAADAYGILSRVRSSRFLFFLILMLLPSLACQAVMQLVSSPSAVPSPPIEATPSAIPTIPAPTEQTSCPAEMRLVIKEANNEHLPPGHFPNVDTGANIDVPLVTYVVNGDKLSEPALPDVPPNLIPYQRDFARQQSAWELFTSLIPTEQRGMLSEYQIITDGPGGVLSAVEQSPGDAAKWILETDIADMPDTKNLAFTLLHEFGHLLTLNSSQVPPDLQVFNNPNSTRVRDRASAACPYYFPGEGCSLPDSYVNTFFQRFWPDIYDEWSAIDRIDDEDRRDAKLHAFYRKYHDRFVDSYAVTSPVEDIAESWAYFVLSPAPSGSTQADQKMEFFYAYPGLVMLRGQILSGLCTAMP